VRAAAQVSEERADERSRRLERELAGAADALQALRRAGREGRSLGSSRARLLLDTLVDAASGLRHELALPPADVLPADVVARELEAEMPTTPTTPARARSDDDPAVLDELLTLPRAHLVVDGYNVTKSAYGTLPLIDQRQRLVTGLAALAARTRVEVTCVFDGAAQDARVTARPVRGVRVLFSEPDEIADELIRRLVRAEPPGRVVVVVSSDREVAEGVRRSGARPVPSTALVRLLARG
ncbi:MAG: NYN domain-containing protein, partial [Actinomycetota bacterium]